VETENIYWQPIMQLEKKKEKEFYGKNNINIDDPIPDALKNEWLKFENKFGICTSITYPRLKAVNSGFKHKKGFNEVLYEKKFNKTFYNNSTRKKATIDKIVADNRDK
jgi:adenine-specific DNA-methyltransferase